MLPHTTPCTRRAALAAVAALALPGRTLARSRNDATASEAPVAPLLATIYHGQVDPARCLVSEKYDGVRALWDGRELRHRSGRAVSAPESFLAALPAEPLDGELWLGRGRFDALSAIVRKVAPVQAEWSQVRYMVFELPRAGGTFAERAARIARLAAGAASTGPGRDAAPFEAVAQTPCSDRAELARRLESVVSGGGEGLMLHLASAAAASGRSDVLMKLKPHLDAEALVVGHREGSGKYRGLLGALEVRAESGRSFLLGSGFTDADRTSPPPIGSMVTYRYRDLTPGGVPRFASYLRRLDVL